MTDTHATRANRCASERAHTEPGTAPTRGRRGRPRAAERAGTGPRVEEPESEEHRGGDQRDDEDLSERREDAESSHPSRRQSVSTREHQEPNPHTALLMAQELLRYRPSAEAHDQWLNRLLDRRSLSQTHRTANCLEEEDDLYAPLQTPNCLERAFGKLSVL